MRKWLKWGAVGLGSLIALVLITGAAVYGLSNNRMRTTYDVPPQPLTLASDSATIAHGERLVSIRGCVECHGQNLGGKVFIDQPLLGRLAASNLTSGTNGAAARYADGDWGRAIRNGVRPDGRPLLVMPSQEFHQLSDDDVAAIVAYIKHVPPVDSNLPPSAVGPLGRALYLAGKIPLVSAELIDHRAARPSAPSPGVTVEYGAYMAASCTGCHGATFGGGPIPGESPSTPPAANLTSDDETGLGSWTEADFKRALREGVRPDGSALRAPMPWQLTARMSDEEIEAVWLYLRSVPPVKTPKSVS